MVVAIKSVAGVQDVGIAVTRDVADGYIVPFDIRDHLVREVAMTIVVENRNTAQGGLILFRGDQVQCPILIHIGDFDRVCIEETGVDCVYSPGPVTAVGGRFVPPQPIAASGLRVARDNIHHSIAVQICGIEGIDVAAVGCTRRA
jgi:hypothetical protein